MTNPTKKNVLVTGGAGYIGSTVCSALIDAGWHPIILDNLHSGPRAFTVGRTFYEGDIADRALLSRIVKEQGPLYATIHCAALIVIPESTAQPEIYYRENVAKSIELFACLRDLGCQRIVFSSSASVYDTVENFMVTETAPTKAQSPYARTKLMMEMVLQDYCAAYDMRGIALRYFNPIGADPKKRTGAYVANPSHILGRLIAVARGQSPMFEITGVNWPTRDGSGIRDYIHVWDLAQAHVKAITHFDRAHSITPPIGQNDKNFRVINLGTGQGVTVKEFFKAFEKVHGRSVPHREAPPRPGDTAGSYASCATAKTLIDWQVELNIEQAIRDAMAWTEQFLQK